MSILCGFCFSNSKPRCIILQYSYLIMSNKPAFLRAVLVNPAPLPKLSYLSLRSSLLLYSSVKLNSLDSISYLPILHQSFLMRCPKYGSGLFLHMFGEFFDCTEFHHACKAVMHTSWLKPFGDAFTTQIAIVRRKWNVV